MAFCCNDNHFCLPWALFAQCLLNESIWSGTYVICSSAPQKGVPSAAAKSPLGTQAKISVLDLLEFKNTILTLHYFSASADDSFPVADPDKIN